MHWRLYEHKIFLTEHLTSYFSAQESSQPSVQTLLILEEKVLVTHTSKPRQTKNLEEFS